MIGPNRTRLDLAYIEGIMLWPDDEAQRAEAIKTGRATFIRDAINAVPSAKRDVVAAAWFDWADLLTDAFPLKHIQQKAKQPFVNGIIIGELLAATIAEHVNRGAVKLE